MRNRFDSETLRRGAAGDRPPRPHLAALLVNGLSVACGALLARYVWGAVVDAQAGVLNRAAPALTCLAPLIVAAQFVALVVAVSMALAEDASRWPRAARPLVLWTSPLGPLIPLVSWGVARVW